MISESTLKKILPNCKNPSLWAELLRDHLEFRKINTKNRVAGFISQCAHESNEFNVLQENLNYSAEGLRKVFPKYFPDDQTAWRYARQPQWIASRVYGGRMGNGGENTKEGWKYRGRGVIQLTGKNNYLACSTQEFGSNTLVVEPDALLVPENALRSAIWFWGRNKLNNFCDKNDPKGLTKAINGGYNGLKHRLELYQRALKFL
jgi:putative chitinase